MQSVLDDFRSAPISERLRALLALVEKAAVEAVVLRMRARPHVPLNLGEMATLVNVSRSHFDRLFREITGVSPRQFQTAVRLNSASRLLLTTSKTVTDVCFDVGYASLVSFVHKFTETFGLSPQRLREVSTRLYRPWPRSGNAAMAAGFVAQPLPPLIRGTVQLEPSFEGLIFVGVFPTPMPIRAPLACTILSAAGAFNLGPIPERASYLFSVALPLCDRPLDFLLNDHALRGGGQRVTADSPEQTLVLRPPAPLDPPMNIALPYLLAEKAAANDSIIDRTDRRTRPCASPSAGWSAPD